MLADASLRLPAYFGSEINVEEFCAFFENFVSEISDRRVR